jgi:hypothetical protein
MESVLPLERWFRCQREGLGYEAWTYAMMQVAWATKILHRGFDFGETKLDGVSTINQWMLLKDSAKRQAYLSEGQLCRLRSMCENLGRRVIALVRAELGPELADEFVFLVRGGASLRKMQSRMHDPCATANFLVSSLVYEIRETSGKLHYGDEEWDDLPEDAKLWFDYLCGNHSRNLSLDQWNREFENYIKDELGVAILKVQKAIRRWQNKGYYITPRMKVVQFFVLFQTPIKYGRH